MTLPLSRPPLARMQFIWAAIRMGKFVNASKLARLLEVSTKCIHRDLEFMRDRLGFQFVYSGSCFSYVQTPGPMRPCPMCQPGNEVLAAFIFDRCPEALMLVEGGVPLREDRARKERRQIVKGKLALARETSRRQKRSKSYQQDVTNGAHIDYPPNSNQRAARKGRLLW